MRPEADFQVQIEESARSAEKSAQVQAQLRSDLLAKQVQAQDRQMHAEESARDSNAELAAVRHQLEQSRAEASELREMNHSRDRSIKSPPQSGEFFSTDGYVHNTPGTVQYSTLNVGPPGIGPSPLPSPTDNCPTINVGLPGMVPSPLASPPGCYPAQPGMVPSPLASPPGYYPAQASVGAPTVDDPSGRFSGVSQAGAVPSAYTVHGLQQPHSGVSQAGAVPGSYAVRDSQQPLHARPDGQYAGAPTNPNSNQGSQPPLRVDVPYDPKLPPAPTMLTMSTSCTSTATRPCLAFRCSATGVTGCRRV